MYMDNCMLYIQMCVHECVCDRIICMGILQTIMLIF